MTVGEYCWKGDQNCKEGREMKEDEKDWLPTQGGTTRGYEAQYKEGDKWIKIPCNNSVPYPEAFGGILAQIELMSLTQAEAHRFLFVAVAEEQGKEIKTRLQEYEIVYEIKARKL